MSYASMNKLKLLWKMFRLQLTTETTIHCITEQNTKNLEKNAHE